MKELPRSKWMTFLGFDHNTGLLQLTEALYETTQAPDVASFIPLSISTKF
jgi:hypothetical protein